MIEAVRSGGHAGLTVRTLPLDRPWIWLLGGWQDLWRAPAVSLAYGAAIVGASLLLTVGFWLADLIYLVLPMAAGFMFVGPLLAVGLYEVSRRLERNEPVSLGIALRAWRANAGQIAAMGLVLMLFMLVWIRLAFLIFALFFGLTPPSWENLIEVVFFSAQGIPFLAVGTAVGAVLAVVVFAISAISIPALLDRDIGVATAIETSVRAVLANWRVMIGWAALIVVFTAAGIVTAFVGLAVTMPLIGHATWHAYRDMVAGPPDIA